MSTTKAFQDTIKKYLDDRASTDALFAESYAKEGKSIEESATHTEWHEMIVNAVNSNSHLFRMIRVS